MLQFLLLLNVLPTKNWTVPQGTINMVLNKTNGSVIKWVILINLWTGKVQDGTDSWIQLEQDWQERNRLQGKNYVELVVLGGWMVLTQQKRGQQQ